MLKQRILSTLRFFDLQDTPLTLWELGRFLLDDSEAIRPKLDEKFELSFSPQTGPGTSAVFLGDVLECLTTECAGEVENTLGYYHLRGRSDAARRRWQNYFYGSMREKRAKTFLPFLRHLPFVRGVAIGGSQALGQQKESSDIDLFIVTQPEFMWLTRTLVSLYFQILRMRRHGRKISNRFCLNHYVAGYKKVDREKNLYKAMEYARLRPVIYPQGIREFLKANQAWVKVFLPNVDFTARFSQPPSKIQGLLESLLNNALGKSLDKFLGFFQRLKIRQDEFTFVLSDELSFHPHSQHRLLLAKFFD